MAALGHPALNLQQTACTGHWQLTRTPRRPLKNHTLHARKSMASINASMRATPSNPQRAQPPITQMRFVLVTTMERIPKNSLHPILGHAAMHDHDAASRRVMRMKFELATPNINHPNQIAITHEKFNRTPHQRISPSICMVSFPWHHPLRMPTELTNHIDCVHG